MWRPLTADIKAKLKPFLKAWKELGTAAGSKRRCAELKAEGPTAGMALTHPKECSAFCMATELPHMHRI